MSKWGKRIEYSEPEANVLLQATGNELSRQIRKHPKPSNEHLEHLASIVEKAARLVRNFAEQHMTEHNEGKGE